MNELASFEDITKRLEVMGKVALQLAQAREADAKARLTRAQASGVEFQVRAALRFLRLVEQETLRMRRRARIARDQAKTMTKLWRSARVLFKGNRISTYPLRRSHLERLLLQVMSETEADLFELKIKKSSRKSKRSFIMNDSVSSSAEIPDVPDDVETVPSLIQFMLDHRLIAKPLGPAMGDIRKLLKKVTEFHQEETDKLNAVADKLEKGALDIWDSVPIFGRTADDSD